MLEGYDPRSEYHLKLINLCLIKELSSETAKEIVDRLTALPSNERERLAKILYELVLESKSEQEILKKVKALPE